MPVQEVAAGLLHLQLVMVPLVFPTDQLVAHHQAAHHIVLQTHWPQSALQAKLSGENIEQPCTARFCSTLACAWPVHQTLMVPYLQQ